MNAINDLWDTYQSIWLIDFLRYFIPVSLSFLIFWVLFAKALAHHFIPRRRPKNSQMLMEFAYSMSTVGIFAIIGVGLVLAGRNGWLKLYAEISDYGWIYFIFILLVMIVIHDAYFYWTHRMMHHPWIYKYVHKVHHKSISPSPWAAYSFHPIEALVQALFFPILLFTIPIHQNTAVIFLIYMIVRNVMGHLGFEFFPKGFVSKKWLNWHTTTTHHNMHHQYFSCNYGLYFSWWDDWMKTTHKKYREEFEFIRNQQKRGN